MTIEHAWAVMAIVAGLGSLGAAVFFLSYAAYVFFGF